MFYIRMLIVIYGRPIWSRNTYRETNTTITVTLKAKVAVKQVLKTYKQYINL